MPKALGKNYGPLIRSRSNATQKSESSFTVFLLLKLKGRSGKKASPEENAYIVMVMMVMMIMMLLMMLFRSMTTSRFSA